MTDMFSLLLDFNPGDAFGMVVLGAVIYLFVLWAALVVWVARDVVARSERIVFHVVALLLVIFLNIFGLVVYLIVRPQKTLLERYYEDLEQRTLAGDAESCPGCGAMVSSEHRYCPSCSTEVHRPCPKCKKLVHMSWQYCPHCKTKQVRA